MQKILTGTSILFIGLFASGQANADLQKDILACSKQQNDAVRLDCYDTVTKYYKINVAQTVKTVSPLPVPAKNNDAITKTAPLSKPEELARTAQKSSPQPETKTVADSFGKTEKEKEQEIQSIQSRYIGTFTQWKKGMKLKLENGQVWKVTSKASGYKKMTNPMVTISKGMFSSFNAKVDGLNAKVKVKRVK